MVEESLLDRIYEAAVFPDRWPEVLQEVAHWGGADAGLLVCWRDRGFFGWSLSPGIELANAWFQSDLAGRTQLTPGLMRKNRAGFVADYEVLPDKELHLDPYFTHCALPLGLPHAAATGIHAPSGDFAIVHLMRGPEGARFGAGDLARLDLLRPHLARAAMLASRWRLETLQRAVSALDVLGLPAAVMTARNRVLCANQSMEAFRGGVVWAAQDRLTFSDSKSAALLSEAVDGCAKGEPGRASSIPLPGSVEVLPAVAHVAPLSGSARDLFLGGLALLVITPLGASSPPAELVGGLFDLTAAEARVASGLLEGASIQQIADRQGVGVETVRTHVKSVLAKSGCDRQAQFVAKFATFR